MTNAFADTNAAEIGTIVTYTCQGGLRFRSGIDTAQIQCTTHREWFPDVDSCQGNGRTNEITSNNKINCDNSNTKNDNKDTDYDDDDGDGDDGDNNNDNNNNENDDIKSRLFEGRKQNHVFAMLQLIIIVILNNNNNNDYDFDNTKNGLL